MESQELRLSSGNFLEFQGQLIRRAIVTFQFTCLKLFGAHLHIDRYLKHGVSKSIARVIKHANFQFYRVHPDRVI